MKYFVSLLIGMFGVVAVPAVAQPDNSDMTVEVLGVYFTPPGHAAAAIIKTIDASEREVLVQAYGFTHNGIAQALVRAHQRGVKVRVLMDQKSKTANRYVIGDLTDADMAVRQDGQHAIAHNKVMVIDQIVVITGSFNFTNSAETRNAENVLDAVTTCRRGFSLSALKVHHFGAQALFSQNKSLKYVSCCTAT